MKTGPAGGAVWVGRIPNRLEPLDRRTSAVYLPPGYSSPARYPVVYLLHGLPGSASSFYDALHFARVADRLIRSGRVPPFVGVMPTGGPPVDPAQGEWAGVWETWFVNGVVPWASAHLRAQPGPDGRTLAGLCAGGYGAIDIGLRHPRLFRTLEAWGAYFAPVFHDGPFRGASTADLAKHDPVELVRQQAGELARMGVRFFISVGGSHGHVRRRWSLQFAGELTRLHLEHELWLLPRSERGRFGRATLAPALTYAGAGPPPRG